MKPLPAGVKWKLLPHSLKERTKGTAERFQAHLPKGIAENVHNYLNEAFKREGLMATKTATKAVKDVTLLHSVETSEKGPLRGFQVKVSCKPSSPRMQPLWHGLCSYTTIALHPCRAASTHGLPRQRG